SRPASMPPPTKRRPRRHRCRCTRTCAAPAITTDHPKGDHPMLTQQTLDKLHALRLTGMLDAFEQQLAQPETHELAFEERLALLLDREQLARDNRRLSRLLKAARLRIAAACVEDIDYRHARGLKRAQL